MSGGTNEARPSVISSIFGVVGRELQQFVLSAAGVNPVPPTSNLQQHVPIKSRGKRKAPPAASYPDEIDRRQRKRARTASPERVNEGTRRREVQTSPAQPSHVYDQVSESATDEESRSPTPVRKRASSVMPGTLYEPSPMSTPEPEARPYSQDDRHVRFASAVKSPAVRPPRRKQVESPSPIRSRNESPIQGELIHPEDRSERRRTGPTRRDDMMDRDMSYSRAHTISREESQFTDISSATPPPSTTDSDEVVYVRHSRHHYEPAARRKELSNIPSAMPYLDTMSSSQTTQTYSPIEPRPLSASREEFSFTSASERSFEQQRISELEQEVKKLREELARSSHSATFAAPPPPPPPPPPLPLPSRIPTVAGAEAGKGSSGLLLNARAALKATPGQPEKAINPSAGMKSTVPADQMAAFLKEMKTVRLRKVASKPEINPARSSRPVLDSLGSSFVEPQQRRTFSQASTSTQSAGSSFATSSISPPLAPRSMAAPDRFSDLRSSRIPEPTSSLYSDTGDLVDEERPPSTPPRALLQPPFRKRPDPSASSARNRVDVDGDVDSMDDDDADTSHSISRHPAANASNVTLNERTAATRAGAFPNRPTTSEPLPTLSPNKPRPKGRISTKTKTADATEKRVETRVVHPISSDEDDDPLSIITPSQPARSSRHVSQASTRQSDLDHHSHSRPRSRARTPSSSLPSNSNMPQDGSAASLEAELKKMIRAEVEREFEAEIQDLNAESERHLTGRGRRSSQGAGFMKGGGGAGEPVWMGNGSDHGVGTGGHLRTGSERERAKGRSKHRTRE